MSETVKRRAQTEARRLGVSFADYVRQTLADKLPQRGKSADQLKQRRNDPLFRLLDTLPPVKKRTPKNLSANHDDYLYGDQSEFAAP